MACRHSLSADFGKIEAASIKKLARLNGINLICTDHSGYATDVKAAFDRW